MRMMDGADTTETNRAAGGALAEIGAMLRRRREEIGQDLATISATTHIKQNYLKAIEDGRRKELPGTAYMIGYLRTYANYLGFDGNRLITDYHDELAGQRRWVDKRADPVEPAGINLPRFQVSPVIAVAGLLILGVAGYVAWGYATTREEDPVQVTAVEPPAEPVAPEPAPVVPPAANPAERSPSGAEASAPTDAVPTDAAPTDAPPEAEQPAPQAEEALLPETEDQVPPEAEIASTGEEVVEESPPQSQVAAQPEAAAEAEGQSGKIVIRARLESWVQITNEKKEIVFSRVLRSGETYTVPEEVGLMFTTGNAGGVEILVDGTKLKSLGTVGLVKRDIPLDPKKLKDGSAFKTSRADPAYPVTN